MARYSAVEKLGITASANEEDERDINQKPSRDSRSSSERSFDGVPMSSGRVHPWQELKGDEEADGDTEKKKRSGISGSDGDNGSSAAAVKRGSVDEIPIEMGRITSTTPGGSVPADVTVPGCQCPGMPAPEVVTAAGGEYKVYKRRWFGLVQLTLLNIIVSWDVSGFSVVDGSRSSLLFPRKVPLASALDPPAATRLCHGFFSCASGPLIGTLHGRKTQLAVKEFVAGHTDHIRGYLHRLRRHAASRIQTSHTLFTRNGRARLQRKSPSWMKFSFPTLILTMNRSGSPSRPSPAMRRTTSTPPRPPSTG